MPAESTAERLARAVKAHRAGDLVAAAQHYAAVVAAAPRHAGAHQMLGVLALTQGDTPRALATLQRAVDLDPRDAMAWSNLGAARLTAGQVDDAIAAFEAALARDSAQMDARYNLARAHEAAHQPARARAAYQDLLARQPGHRGARIGLATLALQDAAPADGLLERLRVWCAEAPADAELLNLLAQALQRQGALEEAARCYAELLRQRPDDAVLLANSAAVLIERGEVHAALERLARAAALAPGHARIAFLQGNAERALDAPEVAIACYQRAVALDPQLAAAWINLGIACKDALQLDQAQQAYERALAIGGEGARARLNRGMLRLLRGEHAAGWADYEARLERPDLAYLQRAGTHRRWTGVEPLQGRSILVEAEQGQGDALQFVRYTAELARRGATVTLAAPPALGGLLASCPGVNRVVTPEQTLPACDFHIPMMSLPHACATAAAPAPLLPPYLQAPQAARMRWRERLANGRGLRVGLACSGNPAHENDRQRSLPLAELAALWQLPGVSVFLVQPEVRATDRTALRALPAGLDLSQELRDWSDTAGLLAELDLVISVDTALAHLAGALARPLWLLLPWVPEWRWELGREDSRWYPSARLFRQTARGDWAGVVARVYAELLRAAAAHPSR